MNLKETLDVLIIARPDHSYNIYKELVNSGISYTYMVFKFLPKWLNNLIAKGKLREIGSSCSLCWSMTLINSMHYNLRWNWLSRIPESRVYQPHIRRFLWFNKPRLIHYWPEYCIDLIKLYKQKNPSVKTIAEIVFLNEQFVLDENVEYLKSLGLECNLEYIKKNNEITKKVMEFETDFMVPSKLVADSFRKYYPEKNFHVFPYGIHISPSYQRKNNITTDKRVQTFVYAGTISVEKGSDMACKWFYEHPEYELHLYGHVHAKELSLFEKYKEAKNIIFHGAVPKTVLQGGLLQYDAGIHLSRFDSYSLSVAEMIGAGLPVVVSSRAGICEEVLQGGFGEVVDLNYDSITSAIETFCIPGNYNRYLDSIDKYVTAKPKSYGKKIVDFYIDYINK